MAHGVSEVLGEGSKILAANKQQQQQANMQQSSSNLRKSVGVMGSRRIFAPSFKLKVLDSYRNDIDCRGNQRATARKYGIHRRQIQKWLQCEDNLRSCCNADGASSSSSSSSGSSSNVATPAGSPQKELLLDSAPATQQQQQQQQQQHHHNGAPASPALNLSLARLHGDELAAAAAAQQHQPPPPPPPPPSSAQALAAQAAATQHQAAAANYRFHGAAATAAVAQPTGYPDLKDKVLPIQQHYPPAAAAAAAAADYSVLELYQPSIYQHHRYFQPPTVSYDEEAFQRGSSSSASASSLLAPLDIKTECASPDAQRESPETLAPVLLDADKLKRERLDEEEHDFQRSASSSVSPPLPSHHHHHHFNYQQQHHHHLEALPPSPQHSDRSTASSSSDSEMDQQPGGPNAADLARRRSFSLRFKLDVLDAFHQDAGVAGNQRATARKFGINRRQVQKWLGQESELRGVIELCGSNNRQRLGPLQDNPQTPYGPESPVDLRTTELGLDYAVDSSLTPPYSAPGCSLSCCQEPALAAGQTYYCYSPETTPAPGSLKRSLCTEACCYPAPKRLCTAEDKVATVAGADEEQPVQETPLCLVKPKRLASEEPVSSTTVPTPPATAPPQPSKKDAILFKPYLDNPVSKKPTDEASSNNNNNNNQEAANLNERPITAQSDLALELSFKLPPVSFRPPQQQQQQQVQYPEYPQRSAFVRYPTSAVHYS